MPAQRPRLQAPDDVAKLLLTLEIPRQFSTVWFDEDHDFAELVPSVMIEFTEEQTAGVRRIDFARPLSPSEIRAVPWQQVIDTAMRDLVSELVWQFKPHPPEEEAVVDEAAGVFAQRARRNRRRLTSDLLERVAAIYTTDGPEAVADRFFVSQRQANRYIARAREEGYLP